MSEQPTDRASEVFRAKVEAGMESMLSAAQLINQTIVDRRRKIPEAHFSTVLLPNIRKWVRNEPDAEPGYWLNVADGLNAEIDVTDQAGNVLFVVPPPFHDIPTSVTPPTGKRFTTPHQLVVQQVTMADNGDTRAVMDIEGGLADALMPRPEDELKVKYLKMYVQIYQRYELPMEELLGPDWRTVLENSPSLLGNATPSSQGNRNDDGNADEDEYIY